MRSLLHLARFGSLVAVSCAALAVAGCEPSAPPVDAGDVDARSDTGRLDAPFDGLPSCALGVAAEARYVATAIPAPDGNGWCCPAGIPSCDCTPLGAWVEDICECRAYWRGMCDLAPPDWIPGTDAHGCTGFSGRFPTTASCPFTPDAGPIDAGPDDAGPTDAGADDAGATDAGADDAGATDAGSDDAGALDAP